LKKDNLAKVPEYINKFEVLRDDFKFRYLDDRNNLTRDEIKEEVLR